MKIKRTTEKKETKQKQILDKLKKKKIGATTKDKTNKKKDTKKIFDTTVSNVVHKLEHNANPLAPFEVLPFPKKKSKQQVVTKKSKPLEINPKLLGESTTTSKKQALVSGPSESIKHLTTVEQDTIMGDERHQVPNAPGVFFLSQCMRKYEQETGKKLPTQDPSSLWASETLRTFGWVCCTFFLPV